jgi:hypothetical protein
MSFGLFHCCELTSFVFSASLFFFFFWPDHTSFFSPIKTNDGCPWSNMDQKTSKINPHYPFYLIIY